MENKTQIFNKSDFSEVKNNVFVTRKKKLIFKKKNTPPRLISLNGVGTLKFRGTEFNDIGNKVYKYNNYVVGRTLENSTTIKFW